MNTAQIERFIIVDDDNDTNLLFKLAIKSTLINCDTRTFTSPEDALAFIDSNYHALHEKGKTVLLLDLNIPGTSGWDFLELYQQYPDEVKNNFSIYILSSSVSETDQERACAHPLVKEYLVKPLIKENVMSILAKEKFTASLN